MGLVWDQNKTRSRILCGAGLVKDKKNKERDLSFNFLHILYSFLYLFNTFHIFLVKVISEVEFGLNLQFPLKLCHTNYSSERPKVENHG